MSAIPGAGFRARYDGLKDRLPGARIPAVAALREAAAEVFGNTGLPTRRVEAWRYTDLGPVARESFREPLSLAEEFPALPPARCAARAVFVDGRFQPELSEGLPGFAATLAERLAEVAPLLAAPDALRPTEALNAMLFEDGLVLDLGEGVQGGEVELLSLASGHGAAVAFHPRHVVRLAKGASLTLIETSTGPEGSRHLHNPAFDIHVAEEAHMIHVRIQREPVSAFHLGHVTVGVGTRGTYDSFSLNAGARVARSEMRLAFAGDHAQAHLNGAQLAAGEQVSDITSGIDHAHPNCDSRQTVKTVLAGRARGVFQGKILVRRPAQKTDGYQMNQALLLSEQAEMDSKPQLEIYADDVKCSHGATVGALDEGQLFYLRSRGIPAAPARAMLVRAFLAEAIETVASEPGRAALEAAVESWWAAHETVAEAA